MEVGAEKMPPAAGTGACHPTLQAPQEEDFLVTFFYKPIDIVGFMCYHAITYKKDMLKE